MKLGDVLKKERERKKLTVKDVADRLGMPVQDYEQMELGNSPAEEWGPRLANLAVALQTPTSRLITSTGKASNPGQIKAQCGKLISAHREASGLSRRELAGQAGLEASELAAVEEGITPLETYAPALLRFAEAINQPIFNLFYPCGLPFQRLQDYP